MDYVNGYVRNYDYYSSLFFFLVFNRYCTYAMHTQKKVTSDCNQGLIDFRLGGDKKKMHI